MDDFKKCALSQPANFSKAADYVIQPCAEPLPGWAQPFRTFGNWLRRIEKSAGLNINPARVISDYLRPPPPC
jgi:hypothetical protein